MKVSDHYRRKPHGCLSSSWSDIFAAVFSNAGAVNLECERLLTSECAEMPFTLRKLAVDLKVCREVKQVRGLTLTRTLSQLRSEETELLEMLANEIERMPDTVRELNQLIS